MAEEVHNRIREARKRQGLTQGELAELLGVQPQTVGKWERGESEPDITYCCSLARLLGVSLDELVAGDETDALPPEKECTAEAFRGALKMRRVFCGYSQTELARLLGLRSQTVSKWECGVCLPDLTTVCALCKVYAVSVTDLCFAQDVRAAEEAREREEQAKRESAPAVTVRKFGIGKRIVASCVAAVAIVLTVVLSVYFGVRKPQVTVQQVQPPPQDTTPLGNLYTVVAYRFGGESETVSVYEGDTANVADPEPPKNYRFIGWAHRDEVTYRVPRNGMVENAKNIFRFEDAPIYAHGEYEAVYRYEWLLEPAQYYDEGSAREQEEQYYKECLKLESFVIAYYEWLVRLRDELFAAYKTSLDEKNTQVVRRQFTERITNEHVLFRKQSDGTYVSTLKETCEAIMTSDPPIETDKFTAGFDDILRRAETIADEVFAPWEEDAATAIGALCESVRAVFYYPDTAECIKFRELYAAYVP